MTPYRTSTRIKLGLIVAAVAIALASLAFTQRLADRLEAQDAQAVEVWARAIEFQYRVSGSAEGPGPALLDSLESVIAASDLPPDRRRQLAAALDGLGDGPPSDGLDFVFSEIIEPGRFSVPAVVTDTGMTAATVARNVDPGADLLALAREMDRVHPPIRIEGYGQLVHYGESPLARLIRLFPVVQLGVVGLFVLVGYLGFSYVRRSEQSSLWVGMAREAAHQLGTPLSSMMGWIELLRLGDAAVPETVADELEHDVERLRRVADRFEKIGSQPALEPTAVRPVLERVADYIRRRVPTSAPVAITVEAPDALAAQLNGELFEWVVENLLKNALDAMDGDGSGRIGVTARAEGGRVVVEVADTGRGMDRATARHVFRPGFSTKRRGWGLGLSLARRIVEAYHGGELSVAETQPGVGTTFRIVLDAAPAPPSAEPAGARPASAASASSGRG